MVSRFSKNEVSLKIALFFNNQRGLEVYKFLKKKLHIKAIFLAKKNLTVDRNKLNNKNCFIIDSTNNPIIFKKLKELKIGLIISAGFPYIFQKKFFFNKRSPDILNLHGGQIPKYRGGSPITWQIINGEKNIGISVMKIDQNIDKGKLLGTAFFQNKKIDNVKDIHKKANKIFPKLIWNIIQKNYLNKKIELNITKKFPDKYYPQRKPIDSLINLKKISINKIMDFYKSLYPLYEKPFLYYGEKKISINDIKIFSYKNVNKLGFVKKIGNFLSLNLKNGKIKFSTKISIANEINNKFLSTKILKKDDWLKHCLNKNCYISHDEKDIKIFENYKKSLIFLKTRKKINNKKIYGSKIKYLGENITFVKKISKIPNHTIKKDVKYLIKDTNDKKKISINMQKKICNLAYNSFSHSRFHADDRISKKFANLIKFKWVKNFFNKQRADKMFIQFYKNQISGFCLYKIEELDTMRIDLIGLDAKFRGKGLAKHMINHSQNNLEKNKVKKIIVSTQNINKRAIELYKTLNYKRSSKSYLYHFIS